MGRHLPPFRVGVLFVVTLLIPLVVCGCARSPEELYTRAKESAHEGDVEAAVMDLKSALQARPSYSEARVLLASQLLLLGEADAAAKELRAAVKLGNRSSAVLPLLVRAELDRDNAAVALAILARKPDSSFDGTLWNLRGEALLTTNDRRKALDAFGQALRLDPRDHGAHLGVARTAWAGGDLGRAENAFKIAASLAPSSVRVLLSKGEFHLARRQFPVARQAFSAAVRNARGAFRFQAQLGIARTLLFGGDAKGARTLVDELIEEKPNVPMAHYVSALVAYQQGDRRRAIAELDRVLVQIPAHLPSISMQGSLYFEQQRWLDAKESFARVVAQAPNDVDARKRLAAAYLRLGRVAKAIETLEPAQALAASDPQLLAMLGAAYLRAGESERGLSALERAATLAPDDPDYRAQLALERLTLGDSALATRELRTAANLRADDLRSDVLLVMVLLRQKKPAEALAEANRLIKEKPSDPVRYKLAASALLDMGRLDDAEANLRKALELAPDLVAAQLNLALIAERRGDVALARRRYEQIWNNGNKDYPALAAIVQIDTQQGRTRGALELLTRVCAAQPRAIEPRSLLLSYYEQTRNVRKALEVAKESFVLQPANTAVRQEYARALLNAGKGGQAVNVLEDLAKDLPDDVDVRVALASARAMNGLVALARSDLERILVLSQGKHVPSLALSIQLAADPEATAAAAAWVRALRKAQGSVPDVHMLEGDLALRERRWPDAIASYRQAMSAEPRPEFLARLVRAQTAADRIDDARAVLLSWLKDRPYDTLAQTLLADLYLSTNQLREAQALFETVLRGAPEDSSLLNNLSWVYLKLGDPRANAVAERALRLASDNPEIMDTAAWTRFKAGRLGGVLELLRAAVARSSNPEIRFHLAAVLARTGDRNSARNELKRILGPNAPEFPSKAEAIALSASI